MHNLHFFCFWQTDNSDILLFVNVVFPNIIFFFSHCIVFHFYMQHNLPCPYLSFCLVLFHWMLVQLPWCSSFVLFWVGLRSKPLLWRFQVVDVAQCLRQALWWSLFRPSHCMSYFKAVCSDQCFPTVWERSGGCP